MPDNWWNEQISKNILLKQGQVVNADSDGVKDVLIQDGIIAEVARVIQPPDDNTTLLDMEGMLVMPGGIDPNTHFGHEFLGVRPVDDFYYGTRAAVSGGTTTIIDLVIPDVGESMITAYQNCRKKADCDVVCDYSLHMAVTWWNKDVSKEMGQATIGCGINSFMMYMDFRDWYMLSDTEIYQVCFRCKKLGALPMIHAENGSIIAENTRRVLGTGVRGPEGFYFSRPEAVEAEATYRASVIANQVKCPIYICNVMSESAAKIISNKKRKGYIVYGETTAAALGCIAPCKDVSFRVASAYITSPPISQKKTTPQTLMKLLQSGDLLTTASNNCSFSCDQKSKGRNNFTKIPIGVNGVEDRMAVVWEKGVIDGLLTPSQFVAVTSTNTAKLFNLYPKKGVIAAGSDADIVVWNPNRFRKISHHNHRQACDYNIFNRMKIHGGPEYVFVKGKLCVDRDVLRVEKGYGNYIYAPCTPITEEGKYMETELHLSQE